MIDTTGKQSLADLRSYQDWYLRYYLKSVPGVAEVAPLGGFVRQYQVNVDPNKLQSFHIPIGKVVDAVRSGNNDVGGRLVEFSGAEYMVRGRGYAQSTDDIGKIVLANSAGGVPVRVSDIGDVTLGPDIRRGVADWNGTGETVAGIVVMRQGENALQVIERVKQKLKDIEGGLPPGVKVVTAYDRSELILGSIENLKHTLIEELVIVAIVHHDLPLALSQRPHSHCHDSRGGHHFFHSHEDDGADVEHHVARWNCDRGRSDGGRGDRRRGADAQEARRVAAHGGASRTITGGDRRGERSGRAEFLRAIGDCGGVSSGADTRSARGPVVQTAGIYQDVFHDHRGLSGDHLGPGDAAGIPPHMKNYEFRPRWLARVTNAVLVGTIHSEETHPISKVLIACTRPSANWRCDGSGS